MFIAYPSNPDHLGQVIEEAVRKVNKPDKVMTWKALKIAGAFIAEGIFDSIEANATFVADISNLNFNVTYEIGYAIGQRKPIVMVKNRSIKENSPTITEVGIFDTIGYKEYSNSDELVQLLLNEKPHILLGDNSQINIQAPVYILEQLYKTDFAQRITTRIKKARFIYRSFDPHENPRLSAVDAINQVAQSHGVLVSLLSKESVGFDVHNMRASFIAGLADGMGKACYILQHDSSPVPLDYRDIVHVYNNLSDIDTIIAEFAGDVAEAFQSTSQISLPTETTILQQLDFGASAAENEMRALQSYYLKTDSFNKALRGEVQLIIGRKGSGKSAIFLQIRDKERSKSSNVVLDLQPDGYQLIKFKELITGFLQEGTFQHTIIAFWEYVILLEICHKLLDNDKRKHVNNGSIYSLYIDLEKSYKAEKYLTKGDFSERMTGLLENLATSYKKEYGKTQEVRLSVPEITNLLYKGDISILKDRLIQYLKNKERVWVLMDNIDKGWPTTGLQREDFIIMSTLIDALRKIQRQFAREKIELNPIIFLRNDVYELLVKNTPDRQKESKELLDWVDSDLLREVVKLRILSSLDFNGVTDFKSIWASLCVSHYKGEETSEYLIDRSLMRPRFLINLLNHCKGFAVNLNHTIIEADDITKGFNAYSTDLLTDISYELRDVFPETENILYNFIGSKARLNEDELKALLNTDGTPDGFYLRLKSLLLWHGFLGLQATGKTETFIYSVHYNMALLNGFILKYKEDLVYVIHASFHPALLIDEI